ncbi:hypothetical protein GA0115252_128821 [Streptomyces sp. DfronAA-171]|nr:hypothetical protein GA0115252_128821 [Streptomyces sp. DfronAA-171]
MPEKGVGVGAGSQWAVRLSVVPPRDCGAVFSVLGAGSVPSFAKSATVSPCALIR